MLTELMQEITRLQQALSILEQIWAECDAYGGGPISKEALDKMRVYFKFDDSE